jgi:hypothetical protein
MFHFQSLLIMGLGYWWNLNFTNPLDLTIQHNQTYVLVMIEHFSKWLESMPLSHYSNEDLCICGHGVQLV